MQDKCESAVTDSRAASTAVLLPLLPLLPLLLPYCCCFPGSSIVFMQLPALQDITALRNIQAVGGDLELYLIPK
jgi:hypothetical protein